MEGGSTRGRGYDRALGAGTCLTWGTDASTPRSGRRRKITENAINKSEKLYFTYAYDWNYFLYYGIRDGLEYLELPCELKTD
jgi:hypothetical protein